MSFPNNDNVATIENSFQSLNIKGQTNVKKKRHAYHVLDTAPSYQSSDVPNASPAPYNIPTAPQTARNLQNTQSHSQSRPGAIGIHARNNSIGSDRYAGGSPAPNDPMTAIPSLTQDRDYAQASLGQAPLFKTFESACPPPACCEYEIQDQGISGPNFARLTMYNIPATEQLRASTKLPLGMLVRPFAPSLLGPQEIPLIDFTTSEPPRCRRCRAYMNPFMLFTDGGTRFVCNMCQFSNPVPTDYFQPTDTQNRRIDCHERPELSLGTYDLAVSKDYWHEGKQPVTTRYLFAIDVSATAIKKQLHTLSVQAVTDTLYGGKFPPGATVAIVTFDQDVQFYNLNSNLEQFQMLVMSDKTDPFVPLEEGLFVDPVESKSVIEELLSSIEDIFGENRSPEPCYGTVLDVIYKALERTGGKVSITLSSLPSRGAGNLYMRTAQATNVSRSGSVDTELLRASSHFFTDYGKKYAQNGIGLDIYAFPAVFMDLANTAEIARASGGHIHYFPSFVPEVDGAKYISEFIKSNTIETGTQCMLKVRCSNGLQVSSYLGNLYTSENHPGDDPFFGSLDAYDTIGVLFSHDGKLDTKLDAHFQAALLYTSATGQRRVRVINVLASVTEQFKPVMSYVDVDSCIGVISREALSHMGRKSCKEIKAAISEKLIEAFAAYRRHAGSSMPASQLLMPVALRSFLIYGLSLLKSAALREKPDNTDSMVASHLLVNTLSADEMALYLYPRVIGLHNLRPDDCLTIKHEIEKQEKTVDMFQMPVNVNATATSLADGGVYLLYNGQGLILFIHKLVNPNLVNDLFGVSELSDLNPYLNTLPEIDTEVSRQSRALIDYFTKQSGKPFLPIKLARQGVDPAEHEFYSQLVEDRTVGSYSYSDYVAHVHRSVKQVMENGNVKSTTHLLNETVSLSHLGL